MTGTVNSAFGLSAFFFSLIARELFPGKTESFLTVLVVGTTLPVLFGAIVIKPELGSIALAVDDALEEAEPEIEEPAPPFERDEETPLRSGEESVLYGERNPWASQAPTPAQTPGSTTPKSVGGGDDVHGLGLVRVMDFWVIFGIVGMCESILCVTGVVGADFFGVECGEVGGPGLMCEFFVDLFRGIGVN